MIHGPRALHPVELAALLALDVPAHLATLDRAGFPHVTPVWFVWQEDAFFMTSISDRPHLRRLSHNPRAGVGVDVEDPERADGQRPNRQVRAIGEATLFRDRGGEWTRRITAKYVRGASAERRIAARVGDERIAIRLRPARLIALASV